jgi:hypothetical protein
LASTKAGIIAGHGRLLAARKLGLKEEPVIVLDHLTDAQKRAYITADDQLALNAGWNDEILRIELAALQQEDFDLSLIGFEDDELARLLAAHDAAEGLTDEDSIPELPEAPVCEAGDLWIRGDHKLLIGDATVQTDADRLMAAEAADCSSIYPTTAGTKVTRRIDLPFRTTTCARSSLPDSSKPPLHVFELWRPRVYGGRDFESGALAAR